MSRLNRGRYYTTYNWFLYPDEWDYKLYQSAIIFADDETLASLNKKVTLTNAFMTSYKFLHYCRTCLKVIDFAGSIHYKYTNIGQFQYFLIDDGDVIKFVTADWWDADVCNELKANLLNTLNKSTQIWEYKFEFEEKFTDFYGCMINYAVESNLPYYDPINNKYTGYMLQIFEIIGQYYNFEPVFLSSYCVSCAADYYNMDDGTDVILDVVYLGYADLDSKNIGTTFSEVLLKFIISPGVLYTPYEKLLLPFDAETWWYLIATFGGAFLVIFLMNLLPKKVKNLIYGEEVRMPAFNVVGTFFGIGQIKLPSNNFARIILMHFIIFCLIIRTAYQGVQFDMMTKEMRRKPAQSLQQLYDENYTIWVDSDSKIDNTLATINDEDINRHKRYFFSYNKAISSLACTFDSSVKQAFFLDHLDINELISDCPVKPEVLDEVYQTTPVGIGTFRNHYLMPAIDKILQMIIPFGIPQYLKEKYDNHFLKPRDDSSGPSILAINDLSFGFVVWLIACSIALCGFLGELLVAFLCKKEITVAVDQFKDEKQAELDNSNFGSMLNQIVVEGSGIVNDIHNNRSDEVVIDIPSDVDDTLNDENQVRRSLSNVKVDSKLKIKKINGETSSSSKSILNSSSSSSSHNNVVIEIETNQNSTAGKCEIEVKFNKTKAEKDKIQAEVDEIENLIQDFEIEMEKPLKAPTDEEILNVGLYFTADAE